MSSWRQNNVDLKLILKGVSRSFYLSLILLPQKIQKTMGVGYLFCRAADTLADTDLIPFEERLQILELYRKQFAESVRPDELKSIEARLLPKGGSAAEESLIKNLPACFELLSKLPLQDQHFLKELVLELTHGMQMDLELFHQKEKVLTPKELDQYIYYVAGVVGDFWTKVLHHHYSFGHRWDIHKMKSLGVRFGKGLQLINLLRDQPADKARGRLYFREIDRPDILRKAREYLESGWEYIHHLPRFSLRLRLVCLVPLLLGEKTLILLEGGNQLKVKRTDVYKILLLSSLFFWIPGFLRTLVVKPSF
ncbi:MAG: phytoene/squalene synthase family protein [bacterium]|nr:phytoene/squalene synthase family protein [bacterium]